MFREFPNSRPPRLAGAYTIDAAILFMSQQVSHLNTPLTQCLGKGL